jgi:cytoskeletal protein CcmA (bactofilin family)
VSADDERCLSLEHNRISAAANGAAAARPPTITLRRDVLDERFDAAMLFDRRCDRVYMPQARYNVPDDQQETTMALFVKEDKTQKSDDVLGTATSSVSGLNSSNTRDVQAHLGQGSRVEGKLTFEGSVRIDGHVEGEISAQDSVIIGEGAEVTAQIHANTVVVQGRVVGDITARKRVELKAPASVVGNISTPTFVVHEGVVFEGHCSMGGAAANRTERGDKRVTLFPAEERAGAARRSSEAAG